MKALEEEASPYLMRGVSVPINAPQEGSTRVIGVRIFTFDNSCCYLVVSYQTEPEPDTTHYVFTSDDPELLSGSSNLIYEYIQN